MRKKIFVLISFVFLIFPREIFAANLNFNLFTDMQNYQADVDNNVSILLMLSTEGNLPITSCTFDLKSDGKTSEPEISAKNGWNLTSGNNLMLDTGGNGVTSSDDKLYSIAKINYVVSGDTTVTISNIKCFSVSDDGEFDGTQNDIQIVILQSGIVNARINGSLVPGDSYSSIFNENDNDFTLKLESNNEDLLNRVQVKTILDDNNNSKLMCDSDSVSDCTITFDNENLCKSSTCLEIIRNSNEIGNVLNIAIYDGSNLIKSFYVYRKFNGIAARDNTIKSLSVYGQVIELEDDKTEYDIELPSGYNNYSDDKVVAVLSDPDNYTWDENNYPDKYDFPTNNVTLIVTPKDGNVTGAQINTYTIHVSGIEEPSIPSASSESSVPSPSSNVPVSSKPSSSKINNPPTGGITEFIVAIILLASLTISLYMYKKNISAYK